jgi:hypothetical protein
VFLLLRKLVESNSRRRVNPDGTIEVFSATIEDDGMYACHVGSPSRPTIYQYMLQVRGKYIYLYNYLLLTTHSFHKAYKDTKDKIINFAHCCHLAD